MSRTCCRPQGLPSRGGPVPSKGSPMT
jgi:hypothetical protein